MSLKKLKIYHDMLNCVDMEAAEMISRHLRHYQMRLRGLFQTSWVTRGPIN